MKSLFLRAGLVLTFYRSFVAASAVITTCCAGLFWRYGFGVFVGLFWLKVLSLGVLFYFVNDFKRAEYYYYHNLGMSKHILWTCAFALDFGLFVVALIAASNFR